MKNPQMWKPSKVVRSNGKFAVSSDPHELATGSRIIASIQLGQYETAIRTHARGRLLDLGCGHVPYYEMYKDLISDCVCVDWENTLHKNELLDMTQDLNQPLQLPSESFDTILLTDVLEHIARPWILVPEIARLLRPEGKVIFTVPFFYWLHEKPYDFYRYTEHALRYLCESNGLKIVSLTPCGGVPAIFADIMAKCLQGAGQSALCRAHVALSRWILPLWPIRAIGKRTAQTFPLFYVAIASKVGGERL